MRRDGKPVKGRTTGRLEGRVAVISGAAQGIGAAIAEMMAEEGAAIALLDVREATVKEIAEDLIRMGVSALPVTCDVANSAEVESAVGTVLNRFGQVDILVNNAGVARDARYAALNDESWDAVMAVNLKGTFNCIRGFVPTMEARKTGRVINIASRAALGNFGQANYAASKAGIVGLTRTIALEVARSGVTVNAVAPGWIDTNMSRAVPNDIAMKIMRTIPLGRIGLPREVAGAVCFLASEDASYVTGQTLFVCGGRSIGAILM